MHDVRFEPGGATAKVPDGTTLTTAAATAGLPITLPCGGLGLCGKCRVKYLSSPPPANAEDRRFLTESQLRDGLRLGCRHHVTSDLTLFVGDEARSLPNQIQTGGRTRQVAVDPGVERLTCDLGKAALTDERDDWTRIETELRRQVPASLTALQELPDALAAGGGLTITLVDGVARQVSPGQDHEPPLGFAVDIGTTTVVCYLIDLESGIELTNTSMLNPQVVYGDDVISRIHYADADARGLRTLQRAICQAVEQLVIEACGQLQTPLRRVARGTVVGNTTMSHLFLGINPRGLGIAPFAPTFRRELTVNGGDLGMRQLDDCPITVLPNIAGFLGSDTTGVLLAAMAEPEGTALAIDIGTNGEMVLHHRGRWFGCSAAAGPAFEGARISCGMRGAAGAIATVQIENGELTCHTIGNQAPRGLCGSGLVDALAELLRSRVLEPTGRLTTTDGLAGDLSSRLSGEGNQRHFLLAAGSEAAGGEPLTLTGADVREVQLAKSSLRASQEALLAAAGVTATEVEAVYLAGGFGNYLDVANALRIGLLAPYRREVIVPVGNAAGAGAKLALVSLEERQRAVALAEAVEVLYLANDTVYQMQFMEQMMFPAGDPA